MTRLLLITGFLLVACAGATFGTIFVGILIHAEYFYEPNRVILLGEMAGCGFSLLWGLGVIGYAVKKAKA